VLIKLFLELKKKIYLKKSKSKEIATEGKIQKLVEIQEFFVSSQSTIARFSCLSKD